MNDLISRQEAIDALGEEPIIWRNTLEEITARTQWRQDREAILSVPSTQLVIRCKDCKHRFTEGENVIYNVCELNHNKVQPDDWFCGDAERSENERFC